MKKIFIFLISSIMLIGCEVQEEAAVFVSADMYETVCISNFEKNPEYDNYSIQYRVIGEDDLVTKVIIDVSISGIKDEYLDKYHVLLESIGESYATMTGVTYDYHVDGTNMSSTTIIEMIVIEDSDLEMVEPILLERVKYGELIIKLIDTGKECSF